MLTYFPSIRPYAIHRLEVTSPHVLYVEESGNPEGQPVLFLHGGPGGGASENSRRLFNPNDYRIILFDQRGAGRSTPHGSLDNNHTQALLADIEQIRIKLNVDNWWIYGSSWGSLLGLIYAQAHPDCVTAMILRGIFLNREQDFHWIFGGHGLNRIFPDHWEAFLSILPTDQRHNPLQGYHYLLSGEDEVARMKAAENWAMWEAQCSTLLPDPEWVAELTDPHEALRIARLQCHYMMNHYFLSPNQVLHHLHKIQHIPALLIHGRYDMICPLEGAWALQKAWEKAELHIVPDAGHLTREPGMLNAVIHATERMIARQK